MDETFGRIAAELAASFENRTSPDTARDKGHRAWEADYGTGKKAQDAAVFLPRLADVSGRNSGDLSGGSETYQRGRRAFNAFRSEVVSWCIGTKVFIVCVGIAAFIVVV